jgi:hypothetical protein
MRNEQRASSRVLRSLLTSSKATSTSLSGHASGVPAGDSSSAFRRSQPPSYSSPQAALRYLAKPGDA